MKTKNGGGRFAAGKGVKKRLSLANQVLEKQQHRLAEQLHPPAKPQLKPALTKDDDNKEATVSFFVKVGKNKKFKCFHFDE